MHGALLIAAEGVMLGVSLAGAGMWLLGKTRPAQIKETPVKRELQERDHPLANEGSRSQIVSPLDFGGPFERVAILSDTFSSPGAGWPELRVALECMQRDIHQVITIGRKLSRPLVLEDGSLSTAEELIAEWYGVPCKVKLMTSPTDRFTYILTLKWKDVDKWVADLGESPLATAVAAE